MDPQATPPATRRPSLKERLKALIEEYGALALGVFIGLSALVYAGAYAAIALGWRPQSTAGTVGTAGAAYVAYRLTLPIRVPAALVLTPLVARALEKLRLRRPRSPAPR
ncbi:MAG TPA: hypothetical protein VE618_00905 [Myxococcaceae bacterium]|jgi:hypothetical protein|nr:hypothetical protein [Myxococcaceae bacterium]